MDVLIVKRLMKLSRLTNELEQTLEQLHPVLSHETWYDLQVQIVNLRTAIGNTEYNKAGQV